MIRLLKLFVSAALLALPLVLSIVLLSAVRPYAPSERRGVGRITVGTILVGLLASGVIAWLRLNTSKIKLSEVNLWLAVAAIAAVVVFLISTWILGSKPLQDISQGIRHRISLVCVHLGLLATITYFGLTYFLGTDAIVLMGSSIWETESLLRLIGFCLGTILVIVVGLIAQKSLTRTHWIVRNLVITIAFLVVLGPRIVLTYHTLTKMRMVPRLKQVFPTVLFVQHHEGLLLLLMAIIAILPAFIAIRAPRLKIENPNPAEIRLHKADKISRRNFAGLALLFGAGLTWTLTDGKKKAEHVPALSEIEPSRVEDGKIFVNREMVSDGHLHRFAYQASDGTEMRFIVIKKNSVAFGTGLDACEICGDAGYYEKGGKVICARCDVVMNIQTIGFKGGCNPIPIRYEQDESSLYFFTEEFESLTHVFK